MPANVETMFSVRETPWHGLGRIIMDAPASREALELAGLDWQVESRNIYSGTGAMIPGYRANVRSTDNAVLGVVSDRYRIVQNEEAFQFTDDLLGEGVTYETAGSLQGGKKVWMQDAAYGTAPGYKVSWVSSESKRVDSQRLKKEQPDIFNRYSKNVSSRRFTIIHAA